MSYRNSEKITIEKTGPTSFLDKLRARFKTSALAQRLISILYGFLLILRYPLLFVFGIFILAGNMGEAKMKGHSYDLMNDEDDAVGAMLFLSSICWIVFLAIITVIALSGGA